MVALSVPGAVVAADSYNPDAKPPERVRRGVVLDADALPKIRVKAVLGEKLRPAFFLRGGKTACGLWGVGGARGQLGCRDIGTGREFTVPFPTRFEGIGGATRLIVSEYRKHTIPEGLANALDLSSLWYTFKQRVVWDVEQNKAVATYAPATARFQNGRLSGTRFFAYAVSPDGHYIAEGSSESVRLYRINP
jgi:hypothetical protein